MVLNLESAHCPLRFSLPAQSVSGCLCGDPHPKSRQRLTLHVTLNAHSLPGLRTGKDEDSKIGNVQRGTQLAHVIHTGNGFVK
jgi:hypothetical protein